MKRSVFSFVVFFFTLGLTTLSFAQASKNTATAQPAAVSQPATQEVKQPQAPVTTETPKSENKNVVKGIVKEVAKDKSYIMVDDNKIMTTKEFLDDSYLEVGDKVEITVEKTDAGQKALSYNYIFEEDPSEDLDTQINTEEPVAKDSVAPKAQQ
jgi:hypothetical protein